MLQSIYTHAGCDYGCLYTYSPRHCFNPHTHAGCDNVHNVSGASFPVSIHTPTQGVTAATIFCSEFNKFQSTHPRRVWLIYHFLHFRTECFNPHTHAGCDDVTVYFSVSAKVSIHTPTQGVTQSITSTKLIKIVSIHTPTQGVTLASYSLFWWYTSFNPHTHAGCDKEIWMRSLRNGLFQSTHPRRVWLMEYFHNTRVIGFNPHTHAGCDQKMKLKEAMHWSFNPHTHAGCDFVQDAYVPVSIVSIHTPTQGVTPYSLSELCWCSVSIHTPTQGVT